MALGGDGTVDGWPGEVDLAISPDGSKIVTAVQTQPSSGGMPVSHIFLQAMGSSTPTDLTPTSSDYNITPTFSPDGSTIVFASNSLNKTATELYAMDTTGANLTHLTTSTDGTNHMNPRFLPDGARIVFQTLNTSGDSFGALYIYSMGTNKVTPISTADTYTTGPLPIDLGCSAPAVRYDGQQLLCGRLYSNSGANQVGEGISTMNLDGSNTQTFFANVAGDLTPQACYSLTGMNIVTMHDYGAGAITGAPSGNTAPAGTSQIETRDRSGGFVLQVASPVSGQSLYSPVWGATY